MKTMPRLLSDYLHVLVAGQRRTEAGDGMLLREFVHHRDGDAFHRIAAAAWADGARARAVHRR